MSLIRTPKFAVKQPGLAPGTLVYTGPPRDADVRCHVLDYGPEHFEEIEHVTLDRLAVATQEDTVTWINVDGIHDVDLVAGFGERLGLHQLVLEDIVSPRQRPKAEVFDDHVYVVVKMLHMSDAGEISVEQVSIVAGVRYVVTFQERPGDVLEPLRNRLRSGRGLIRKNGPDYLTYAIVDTVVDNYFHVVERLGEQIERLEEEVSDDPSRDTLRRINDMKRDILMLRKNIWPLREVMAGIERDDSVFFKKRTKTYLRDVYDHVVQVIDFLETYRDLLSGLTDLYLSSISHRMNEIMQVLTIVGSIFIPLTFIAGIYGMNFAWMPELGWKWGYPVAWGVMLTVAVSLILFFRRRNWL
ncbi:MAG: magnesium/cobalt transporter CorA [Rhodothermales bacterium]|nr:magnesium/cobalt transporter CorA [Rhodothermales bacterium]